MTSAETIHLDGLFHLGAMAVAVTAAYVGLDRIKTGTEKDEFSEGLTEFRDEARKFLVTKFDVRYEDYGLIRRSLKLHTVIVLCYIAYSNAQTSAWTWPFHFAYRHLTVPFYRYFFGRTDITVLSIACVASLASLLYLIFLQVFEFDLNKYTHCRIDGALISVTRVLYCCYAVIIVVAFSSVLMSSTWKLAFLRRKLDRLYSEASDQWQGAANDPEKAVMEFGPIVRPRVG